MSLGLMSNIDWISSGPFEALNPSSGGRRGIAPRQPASAGDAQETGHSNVSGIPKAPKYPSTGDVWSGPYLKMFVHV